MFRNYNMIAIGLFFGTFLCKTQCFVLLTANVEDLKRIAQKFVSDSLADKIARFIIEAADNNIKLDNNSNVIRNLSEYNDEFDVEKKDLKQDYDEEFRQKSETNAKQEETNKQMKFTTQRNPTADEVQKDNKKVNKKKKQFKNKTKAKKTNKITTEQSSLEYYRSEKQLNELNPNLIIDLEKIQESDDSSAANVKQSRKEFNNPDYIEKTDEIQLMNDKFNANIHKYIENDVSTKQKKDTSENASYDFHDSNRLDTKSVELPTGKTNLTTEIERNEFDQYFNTNYPKAEVVATSGPVELTKPTKNDSSDTDYE